MFRFVWHIFENTSLFLVIYINHDFTSASICRAGGHRVDVFPVRFLTRTGLNTVVFCDDLTLNGIPADGVAAGNVMYLSSSFSSHVVYHELFHVAAPHGKIPSGPN